MGTQSRLEASPLTPEVASPAGADLDAAAPPDEGERGGAPFVQPELLERLLAQPWSFEFFRAVHLLERLHPDRQPIGRFGDPARETLRLRANSDASFPASELQLIEQRDGRPRGRRSQHVPVVVDEHAPLPPPRPLEVTVNFMGLNGPQGMLPLAYTHQVAARLRAGDATLKEFFDLFNHRVLSLFYRAWQHSHLPAAYEAAHDGGERDRISPRLRELIGLGEPHVEARLGLPPESLAFYAGLLALQTRPAVGLEQLLGDYFRVPIAVEQFVGGWYPLDLESQTSIGTDWGNETQLGLGAVAGDEIWDPQARARIRVGPLSRARYDDFLPTGEAYGRLMTLARFYANDQIDFEVQLVLERADVPGCVLGDDEAPPTPLGWCTWLKTKEMERDPDETVLTQ
ncbi:MAG TPA: type VI secretion system baseplate subunit TssG [Gemmatimonadaceae bacterium]|nr:type VI secretion system baseplate subunit TssG [Gemmatimonadaceae bacterium]